MKTRLSLTVVSGVLSVSLAGAQPSAERYATKVETQAVAAVVDGHTIPTSEVENSAMRRYGQKILDAEGSELTRVFGQKRTTITKQFYRGMRKAAFAAGIKWY